MSWFALRMDCPLVSSFLVFLVLGFSLAFFGNKSLSKQIAVIDTQIKRIDDGSQLTCTLGSTLVNATCRHVETCLRYEDDSHRCYEKGPLAVCFCEASYFLGQSATPNRAKFVVHRQTETDGCIDWCNEALHGTFWPNFMAYSRDGSSHKHCGYDEAHPGYDFVDSDPACTVDMALDPDYKCATPIKTSGFPCVEATDGHVWAGLKEDIVVLHKDCSRLINQTRFGGVVIGIAIMLFSCLFMGCFNCRGEGLLCDMHGDIKRRFSQPSRKYMLQDHSIDVPDR